MKKIIIPILVLIVVFASVANVFADDELLLFYKDKNPSVGDSTTYPTATPRLVVGKWADNSPMYFTTRYAPNNSIYGFTWALNNGIFTLTSNRLQNYYVLAESDHLNKTIQIAWNENDMPFEYSSSYGQQYYQSDTGKITSTNVKMGGSAYRDGWRILTHYTNNDYGYGKAYSYPLEPFKDIDFNKLYFIEGTVEDMQNYIDSVESEAVAGNGLTNIFNPTFTVKAGYGLILELSDNTLGIAQYIDYSSTPAKAPLFGKWITGASEHFSNNLQYVYDSKNGIEINFTRENGGVLKSATKGSHYTDMGAASNYKYYMLVNPPTNWKGDNVDYTVPVTVKVTGAVKRAILYPTTYDWTNDSVYFDTESERKPITYVDSNGELEQREIVGNVDINSDNPNITLGANDIGNITTQLDINNNSVDNAISGINDLINSNNDSSNKISEQFKEFFSNLKGIYAWLPDEVFSICVGMFSIVLAIYVIKLFR